jgi:hypothetical protein
LIWQDQLAESNGRLATFVVELEATVRLGWTKLLELRLGVIFGL